MSDPEKSPEGDENMTASFRIQCTGVGAFLKNLSAEKNLQPSNAEANKRKLDNDYLSKVCDTGRNVGPTMPKFQKLNHILDFYCDACQIQCNSLNTFEEHIKGQKHFKRAKNHLPKKDQHVNVRREKNVHQSLQTLLTDSSQPIVGLKYVDEILSETRDEEPAYRCRLCNVCCLGIGMFQHLTGHKHRSVYLDVGFGWKNLNKEEILTRSQEMEQKEGRNAEEIKIVVSDKLYPWLPGQEPKKDDIAQKLLKLAQIAITSETEVKTRLDAVEYIVEQLVIYKLEKVADERKESILSCASSLINSLRALMGIPNVNKTQEDPSNSNPDGGASDRAVSSQQCSQGQVETGGKERNLQNYYQESEGQSNNPSHQAHQHQIGGVERNPQGFQKSEEGSSHGQGGNDQQYYQGRGGHDYRNSNHQRSQPHQTWSQERNPEPHQGYSYHNPNLPHNRISH